MTTKKGPRKILAWHFLLEDRRLRWGTREIVEAGKTYSLPPDEVPKLCKVGFHGSRNPLDALEYAPGAIVCRVRLWGDVQEEDDKVVARHREVLAMADATRTLHEFAIWCAERALALTARPDPRSVNALAVKRRWLDGQATDTELAAARAAAGAAAGAAARAWYAAWAAAGDAARDAAWAAARAWYAAKAATRAAAGDAAWAAADAAAGAAQNRELERRLRALLKESP